MSTLLRKINDIILLPQIRTLTRGKVDVTLSGIQWSMFLLIADARVGMTPEAIYDELYIDRREPELGRRCVHMHRIFLNRKIARVGLHVATSRRQGGFGSVYKLAMLEMEDAA